MIFEVTKEQMQKIGEWVKEQDQIAIARQKKTMSAEDFSLLTSDGQYPYTGACGGGLTYSFTHTSLGMVTKVHYALNDETLDVTDYNDW